VLPRPVHVRRSWDAVAMAGMAWRGGLLRFSVVIRDALPGEFAEVARIRLAAYQAGGYLLPSSRYAPMLAALGTADDGTVMLQLWPRSGQMVTAPDEAEIRALAVTPGCQGQGTGRALLRAVTGRAAAEGIRHLVLCTQRAMFAAHHLYEQAGFIRLPERDWSPGEGEVLLAYGRLLAGHEPASPLPAR